MEGSRCDLACQKFPVANSSVVERKRNEPAEACPTPPCLLGTMRTGTLLGSGMVVGVSWKAVWLSSWMTHLPLLTRSCPVAEVLLMSACCGLQDVLLQDLAVWKAGCQDFLCTCDTN